MVRFPAVVVTIMPLRMTPPVWEAVVKKA